MTSSLLVAMVLLGTPQHSNVYPGQLRGHPEKPGGPARVLPLLDTSVTADIAGIAARVTVVQTFKNPYNTPIEAVYTFPLRSGAAVDRMRMKIGDRIIEGEIKRAEEARRIYEAARAAGQAAALLDQERPNIFTQSVANIMPGEEVRIEISYVDVLEYKDGEFEFVFPMVVGPRNTMNALDPDKIFPPITPEGTRTGANIELSVFLDAGAPLQSVTSELHAIDVQRRGPGQFQVSLARKDEIPNRDFILRWRPEGEGLAESFITHAENGGGTFCLTIIPPKFVTDNIVSPREVIFVMDQSGSMTDFPIEKSKELTIAMIDKLRKDDTFNVVTFNTSVNLLWPEPVPNNRERVREAKQFVRGLTAGGGTNFLPPLTAALGSPPRDGRLRIVVFNSDGYVGDDFAILAMVRKNKRNGRLFTFGIGNAVNRFLIDGMSYEGRGDSEIVTLGMDAGPPIERFIKRTQSPILTDVTIMTSGGGITDVTPSEVPDLFDGAPLVIFGRYSTPGPAKIILGGQLGGRPWSRTIDVVLSVTGDSGDGITKAWARRKLDDMVRQDWMVAMETTRGGKTYESDNEPFTLFALTHGIMSQWTSFVAVEKRVVNIGGRQRTVRVPVEMAEGVSYDGIFGNSQIDTLLSFLLGQGRGGSPGVASSKRTRGGQGGGGFGGGGGGQGGVGQLSGTQGLLAKGITSVVYDPTTNSYIVVGTDGKIRRLDEVGFAELMMHEDGVAELKIHKDLLERKSGEMEVQVLVKEWPEGWKKLLKDAGFELEDSLEDLKVVFGTIDAKMLLELAKLDFVTEIRPLDQ
ncbi:MAG: VWA domain-containing protein [Armatimonadetes bacterium]|nr:VWA domain-containing protein [Armatimonadota bacterium]